jgi:hypothetical protein
LHTTVLVFLVLITGVWSDQTSLLTHVRIVNISALNFSRNASCLDLLLAVGWVRTINAGCVNVLVIAGLCAEQALVCLELVPPLRVASRTLQRHIHLMLGRLPALQSALSHRKISRDISISSETSASCKRKGC